MINASRGAAACSGGTSRRRTQLRATDTNTAPILTETIAVRLTLNEFRTSIDVALQADRTVNYIVRAQVRKFQREQQHAA